HRDIKPEHILLTAEGRVVLIDLDASMRILSGKKNDTQLLGTAMYAAPEQFGLTRSDERADIYALGILMNEMLTGEHPAVIRYQEGPLAEIIERCIRMNPAERYQTVADLEQELQRLAGSLQAKKRKKPAMMLAGAVLCAVIGLFALMPQQETPGETLPMYGDKSHKYDLYYNFRIGAQSRSLYTETNMLIDQTWKVYADPNVGVVEGWSPRYEGWTVSSEGCNMGETGYIHAEKDGKHYTIAVQVQGEPMSAYSQLPSKNNLAEGYLQPEEEPGFPYPGVVNLSYSPEEAITVYLAAMEGFYNLQPVCDSGLVTIEPCEETEDWDLPVFAMTFRNPEGGDVQLKVESNCTPLQFRFTEKG
ncbi:MAG: protein kinase, partial [Firmicutes bacterium]|nr:protein kinase [Bacillota bacterium]